MGGPRSPRAFAVNPELEDDREPICLGLAGPPGGGKTVSALRIATGMSKVTGGRPALIDTEAGRARKYLIARNPDGFDFDYIPFAPPFKPEHFLDAIHRAAELNPSAIIVDNASDEHEGPGGVLEWHDENIQNVGGNEWAAWNAPKASRRILTSGIQQIKIPIILTFRARQKTTTEKKEGRNGRMKETPVKLGYMPVAGEELLGIMDLVCLLPPRSNGVAVWQSSLAGEDFTIKVPNYLAKFINEGAPLSEDLGEAIARWQKGDATAGTTTGKRTPDQMADAYIAAINAQETLDDLLAYQALPQRKQWLDTIKEKYPAIYDRVVEAQSRKAQALRPVYDDVDDEDVDQFPAGEDD